MIEVFEIGAGFSRTSILTFKTFDEAMDAVRRMKPVHLEADAQYANCADAYLYDGRCLAIQPFGFDINKPQEKV